MNVLVLDGESKTALAATRSLGRRGVHVVIGSRRRLARAFTSKYAAATFVYPRPEESEQAFVSCVEAAIDRHGIDVVLPLTDASTRALSKHKESIAAKAAIPVADWPIFRVAASKARTIDLASSHGVMVPRTYAEKSEVESFPVVVKRAEGSGGVRYVNDRAELDRLDVSDSIIQEYVAGEGFGFFALCDSGVPLAFFMHRRRREYPVTGGASTAAESIYDAVLRDLGTRLLTALHWHGVAMVEFKKDRDGAFKLMEVNPKFWGSLDLAIAAGVDFPWLAVNLALGNLGHAPETYLVGVRFQWVWDDLLHLLARPSSWREVVRDLRRAQHDISLDDWRPVVFDAVRTAGVIGVRTASRSLRRPHGAPRVGESHREG